MYTLLIITIHIQIHIKDIIQIVIKKTCEDSVYNVAFGASCLGVHEA